MLLEECIQTIKEIINSAQSFHVYTHANPDGDAIASVAAINKFLKVIGKTVVNRCDTPVASMYNWFKLEISNSRNLGIPNVIIAVDFGQKQQLGLLYNYVSSDFRNVPVINIDHHFMTNENFGTINLIEDCASTTLVLYHLFKQWPFEIDKELATYLYYGVVTDTYYFQKANTTSYTIWAAAELTSLGANPAFISQSIHKTKSDVSLKFWGEIISQIRLYHNGEIAVASISKEILNKYKVEEYEANLDGLINFITAIRSTKITILLKERSDEIRVSLRSDLFESATINKEHEIVNVSKIAQLFNGGGHIGAAGCTLRMSLDKAEEVIVQACSFVLGTN